MKIEFVHLDENLPLSSTIVVIDVIRAFTTAALAYARSAHEILLARTLEGALDLKRAYPDALLVGEKDGIKVDGFDLGNSPSLLPPSLKGRTIIMKTSAGTKGVMRYLSSETVLAGSFSVAEATARYLLAREVPSVTFLITGGDEDLACAEYIGRLIERQRGDRVEFLARVLSAPAAKGFLDPNDPNFPAGDIPLCASPGSYGFVLKAITTTQGALLQKIPE